jgi:hypothetical protein
VMNVAAGPVGVGEQRPRVVRVAVPVSLAVNLAVRTERRCSRVWWNQSRGVMFCGGLAVCGLATRDPSNRESRESSRGNSHRHELPRPVLPPPHVALHGTGTGPSAPRSPFPAHAECRTVHSVKSGGRGSTA